MKTQNSPSIVRGRTELRVYHEGKEIAFVHPSQGPHNYRTVGAGILARNLAIPTGDQIASLVYGAYDERVKDEPEFEEVRDIIKNRWLWVFNRNLWTPRGVYVLQDNKAVGTSEKLDARKLESMLRGATKSSRGVLFSKDRTLRFASEATYNLGDHTPKSLAEDGFIIASFGAEGAEKLAEVSKKFKCKPRSWGIEANTDSVQTVSALYVYYSRLGVDGDNFDDGGLGHAFGV